MKRLLCLLIASAVVAGCTRVALVVLNWPARLGGYELVAGEAYGEAPRQTLDIYIPDALKTPRPVVIFFYGGRWSSGSRRDYRFAADALTALGYVVVIPDYRLYPGVRFPAFVEDAASAVSWVHAHIGAYGGDPARLFVMGHSSGAHLAAMLALDGNYLLRAGGQPGWIDGMIGLAGPYDFLPLEDADLQEMFGPPVRYPLTQPIHFAHAGQPPLLLLHGTEDETVAARNSVDLTAATRAKGAQAELRLYEGIGHVGILAALARPFRGRAPVVRDTHAFITAVLESEAR